MAEDDAPGPLAGLLVADEVLGEVGYDKGAIEGLRAAGVV